MDIVNFIKENSTFLNVDDFDIKFINDFLNDSDNVDITYFPILNYKLLRSINSDMKNDLIKNIGELISETNSDLIKFWDNNLTNFFVNNINSTQNKDLVPVVIFVYNRLDTLEKLISSLKLNPEFENSEVIIFSDGPKNNLEDEKKVSNVRNYIKSLNEEKNIKIYESSENKGLANSIISGLDFISNKYKSFIVLEDDLLVSPFFLRYMNLSLKKYEKSKKVWCINGFSPDPQILNLVNMNKNSSYWTLRASSHGWGTWSDRWKYIDWSNDYLNSVINSKRMKNKMLRAGSDSINMIYLKINNKIDSWAIRWVSNVVQNNGLCLNPYYSHTTHQFIIPGTHIKTKSEKLVNNLLLSSPETQYPKKLKTKNSINKSLQRNVFGPKKFERLNYLFNKAKNLNFN